MNALNITIAGQRFDHMVYHFVLTYSNWELVTSGRPRACSGAM
jgi:hypothetical protein